MARLLHILVGAAFVASVSCAADPVAGQVETVERKLSDFMNAVKACRPFSNSHIADLNPDFPIETSVSEILSQI